MVKIEFNTADLTEGEARGLVALFADMFGALAIYPKVDFSVGVINRAPLTRADISDPTVTIAEKAPDGYPAPPAYTTAPASLQEAQERIAAVTDTPTRDTAGIPWDERIHASTKTTNKDGTWTRRRNTPDETFDAVMAELRGANTTRTMEAAAPLVVPAPPSVPAPPAPEPTAAEAFTPPANVVIPPAPVTTTAPTFVQIMQKVTGAQQAGKLDKAGLDGLLAQCDLDGVAKLVSANEGTRAAFDAVLSAYIA